MKILVLGGTGAMGVSLVEILSAKGNDLFITSRKERISDKNNIHYIVGNAHDDQFLNKLLEEKYDAVVDFMVYTTEEFKKRYDKMLNSTDQYIFLSSSRVYAENNGNSISEDSDRLLDVCKDNTYLMKDEYALAKARQENFLLHSGKGNYTIIRPYITYNTYRLQLGVLEKEYWLQRALQGKTIIFQKDIAFKRTTMSYGYDVANAISLLIGNEQALGEAFHITGNESILWRDVLKIYTEILYSYLKLDVKTFYEETTNDVAMIFGNYYQIHYDRLYNREFDNSKLLSICGENFSFTPIRVGLKRSLEGFLNDPKFDAVNLLWEAHCDGLVKEKRTIRLERSKDKVKYFIFREIPWVGRQIKKYNIPR